MNLEKAGGVGSFEASSFDRKARMEDAARVRKQHFTRHNGPTKSLLTVGIAPNEPRVTAPTQFAEAVAFARWLGAQTITAHTAIGDTLPGNKITSNNGKSIVGQGRLLLLAQGALEDATAANQGKCEPIIRRKMQDALRMMTIEDAAALNLETIMGSITPRRKADSLIIIPLSGTDPVIHNGAAPSTLVDISWPIMQYVSAPADVDTVFIDGRIRKPDAKAVLDEAENEIGGTSTKVTKRAVAARKRITGESEKIDLSGSRKFWNPLFGLTVVFAEWSSHDQLWPHDCGNILEYLELNDTTIMSRRRNDDEYSVPEGISVARINGQFPDYYRILSVARDAPRRDIIRRYRDLALTEHPDKGGSAEKFAHISNAREMLSDDAKRKKYDNLLKRKEAAMARKQQRDSYEQAYRDAGFGGSSTNATPAAPQRTATTSARPDMPRPPPTRSSVPPRPHVPGSNWDPPEHRHRCWPFYAAFSFNFNQDPLFAPAPTGDLPWTIGGPVYCYCGSYMFHTKPVRVGPFTRYVPPYINYQYNGKWGNNKQAANAVFEADGEMGIWDLLAEVDSAMVSMCKYMGYLENVLLEFDALVKVKLPWEWGYPPFPGTVRPNWDPMKHGTPDQIQRLYNVKELLWELLKWLGCGYEYHKDRVDLAREVSLRESHSRLGQALYAVSRVQMNCMNTEREIAKAIVLLRDQNVPALSAAKPLAMAILQWQTLVQLPDEILGGIDAVIFGPYKTKEDRQWTRKDGVYPIEAWKKPTPSSSKPKNGRSSRRKGNRNKSNKSSSSSGSKMDWEPTTNNDEGIRCERVTKFSDDDDGIT